MNGLPSITEILSKTRIISAAELLAFAGGAIEVVPPPGDTKVIVPLSSLVIYNFNTVDFASTPLLELLYHGTGTFAVSTAFAGVVGNGISSLNGQPGMAGAGSSPDPSTLVNKGLDLVLSAGAFALAGVGAASVTAGGTGYAIGDTGTITTGGGNATYRVLTVSGLGAVLTFAITFPGSGYATGAGQATATGGAQPGVGINFTVDVTSIVDGDGTIKVTTLYQVIDVP